MSLYNFSSPANQSAPTASSLMGIDSGGTYGQQDSTRNQFYQGSSYGAPSSTYQMGMGNPSSFMGMSPSSYSQPSSYVNAGSSPYNMGNQGPSSSGYNNMGGMNSGPPSGYNNMGSQGPPPSGYGPPSGYNNMGGPPPSGYNNMGSYGSPSGYNMGSQGPPSGYNMGGYGQGPPSGYNMGGMNSGPPSGYNMGSQGPPPSGYGPPAGYNMGGQGQQQIHAYQGSTQVSAIPVDNRTQQISGYNKMTGTKRAVLIGINYLHSQQGRLRGCINDVHNIRQFLLSFGRFPPENVYCLTDDQPINSKHYPNHANLIAAMHWLVGGATEDDSLFFHFSGHGGQAEDPTHLEDDGLNETILPADYKTAGMIIDDDLHKILVKNLPAGCRFTAIFDSCHSGTALDLPYIFKVSEGDYKNAHKAEDSGFKHRHKNTGFSITKIATNEISYQVKKKLRGAVNRALNTTKADVIMFAGCRDEQTSADASIGNQATGAMSYAFIQTLQRTQGQISYCDLLEGMRRVLHDGPKQYSQVPQLSYGRPMDMSQPFML